MVRDGYGTEGAGKDAHDAVAWGEGSHVGADLDDNAGALAAKGPCLTGVHAKSVEDIAEIEASRVDSDSDLAWGEGDSGLGICDEGERLKSALGRDVKAPRGSTRGQRQGFFRARSSKPGYMYGPFTKGYVGLAGGKSLGKSAA
jgi:hypothetical protein